MGTRKKIQDKLQAHGFSVTSSYQIACKVKQASAHKVIDAFATSLKVARDEVYWYRILPHSKILKQNIICWSHRSPINFVCKAISKHLESD